MGAAGSADGTVEVGAKAPTPSSSSTGPLPTNPMVYLTSTGFVTDTQWVRFIKIVLKRKEALLAEDEAVDMSREALIQKYATDIRKLKVTYINDASYHRPPEQMAAGRAGDGKVGDNGFLGRGEGTWFWWDQGLEDLMGIPNDNIDMVQLLEKPWLFNHPERLANTKAHSPDVAELDPWDEMRYRAALKLTQDAYDALKKNPPLVGAGQGGGSMPGCPACPVGGANCASKLAHISNALNQKYAAALDRWCTEHFDQADIVVGQGGEVVMLNMAWQCNQAVADRLVKAVRNNGPIYAGLSASTMVCAKSMEMTGEIQPGWIEAFAAHEKYLSTTHFGLKDLDGEGIQSNVLGALPLLESPLGMRPHYSEAWEAQVLEKNLLAEKEFEEETGIAVPDHLVLESNGGCEAGCRLLSMISMNGKEQDHPVFVPIRNGKVIEVSITVQGGAVSSEQFQVIP